MSFSIAVCASYIEVVSCESFRLALFCVATAFSSCATRTVRAADASLALASVVVDELNCWFKSIVVASI